MFDVWKHVFFSSELQEFDDCLFNVVGVCSATVMYVMWLRLAHIGRLLLTNRIVKHRRKEGGTVYGSFTASKQESCCSPL